jgi:hypothetical protein
MISDFVASTIWFDPSARATLAQGVADGARPDPAARLAARADSDPVRRRDNYSDDAWNVESARDDLIAVGVTHAA